ncbi:MAG: cytidylate kinase-like family protein [Clostridium sp.]|nr:cytidylate kinase-like family protein [Lachnoclostridium sp.]MCM1253761.1 cytidylate kinase-like family protein [Clostridium sp.]
MNTYVITIARGFGSGGKEIGLKLAGRLGIPCYERQILKLASEESGLSESLFSQVDERLRGNSIIKRLKTIPFHTVAEPQEQRFESDINLYNIQAKIIRNLADTTSCIILGKAADYVLKDYPNVASFYIEAPRAACVKSIMEKMGVSEQEAHKLIRKTDKYRADYYKYYTNGNYWTNPVNYDLTLNSDRVGRDACVDVIEQYVKYKFFKD